MFLHLVPRSKNAWSYTSTPPVMPSWHGAQKKHRDNVTFYLYLIGYVYNDLTFCCNEASL
jgi:hypothetical protein